jgi:large subunit ribosomal protein L22
MGWHYSSRFSGKVAKARVEGVDASFKDLCAVADNIRYKKVAEALKILEDVISGKMPIYYRRHNKKMAHRRELGGKKGRWPKKEARIVLKLLKSAIANARNLGMDEEKLKVIHAAANKKNIYPRLQPKGRRIRHNYETARFEVALAEG